MPDDSSNAQKSEFKTARFWLAIGVTVISIVSVAALAAIIIISTIEPKDKAEVGMRVLGTVLPLLGTWVGTVLAYYFSKENFEAATRSVTELAKQITPQEKLKSTPVSKVMILRKDMFEKTGPTSSLKLNDILTDLENAKKGDRIPILGSTKGEVQYIFHRSIVDRFLALQARSGKSASELAALTFDDLLKDADLRKIALAFGVVKLDSTLSDAADVMNRDVNCQDVFVTQSGARDEGVLGWITNNIIQENAKV